ncbi:MAG TPA: VOC family protein [Ignavibacteriaceae bacterium]|jgi:predicted enzyme related to lactoylglutathione lyase|nr:VOC family protein [Ignavibacteriaceae bacterium]
MTDKENSLNWFEISVKDFDRSKKFYETIFDIKMATQNMMGMEMAFFPWKHGSEKASGGLVKSRMHKPSADGVKLYLNGDPDLSKVLNKVEKAGGKITMPKTKITDDAGYMAFFLDTEGNSIGLHSQK